MSSSIARFEYDASDQTLSIWFVTSGRRYDYYRVPRNIVEEFRAAISKGRYFNENIRDRYASEWQAWTSGEEESDDEAAQPVAEPSGSNIIPFPSHRTRSGTKG